MATDKAWYVFRYYAHFMTKEEHLAHRHLVGAVKAMRGLTDVASQTEARKNASPVYRDMLSNDPDVLGLTSEGLDAFVERVAQRILGDHRHEVGFNNCQNAVLWHGHRQRGRVVSAGSIGTEISNLGTRTHFTG